MSSTTCPPRMELAAFALGAMSESALEAIVRHIENCPACDRTLQELDQLSDPVIAGLRRSGPAPASVPAYSPPASGRLGDYQLLREVGRGGMGVVYEAQQVALGRRVALKVLLPHALLDASWVERFRREARSAGRLHHTNIVPIHEAGEAGGLRYFAMQFIAGAGLNAVIRQLRRNSPLSAAPAAGETSFHDSLSNIPNGPLLALPSVPAPEPPASSISIPLLPGAGPAFVSRRRTYWESVARVGIQAAEALQYAHSQGVLHRDVKPSNLLLDDDGTLWVSDFGLAKGTADAEDLTHTGDLIGTLRYVPPERFEGVCDARGDVYGLGLTLYELLTLRPAFGAVDRTKLLAQVMQSEPPRPRRLEPAVPRDLETIVLKSIARDPAQRYQTAKDMADDLRRFLDDRPIRARRPLWPERLLRWARRDPGTAGLVAALVVVVLAGFLGVFAEWRRAETKADLEIEARERAERAETKAQTNLYFNLTAQARLEARLNNVAGAEQLLDRCEPAARGWEHAYLHGVNNAELLSLEPGQLVGVSGLAFSPDGRFLACARWNPFNPDAKRPPLSPEAVEVWDMQTQRAVCQLPGPTTRPRIVFSPDSRFLVVCGEKFATRLWEVGSWQLHRELPPADEMVFHPSGKWLAAMFEKTIRIQDTVTGAVVHGYATPAGRISFSHDGRLLAVAGEQAVELRDWETERVVKRLEYGTIDRPVETYPDLAFSSDGKWLALATTPPTLWDVATGQLANRLIGHQGFVLGVAFSPDSRTVITTGADTTVRLWDSRTGTEQTILRGHHRVVGCVSVHPDGWCLASAGKESGDVKVWDLTSPQEFKLLDDGSAVALTFEPGGGRLRSVRSQGKLEAWDVETGRILSSNATGMTRHWLTPANLAAFSGDGQWLGVVREGEKGVQVLDAATARERILLGGMTNLVTQVALDRDGGRVAATALPWPRQPGVLREIRVWDAATGKSLFDGRPHTAPLRNLPEYRLHGAVALSPDGTRVAFDDYPAEGEPPGEGRASTIRICEVDSGKVLLELPSPGQVLWSLAFSANGRFVVAGYSNGLVMVWGPDGIPLHEQPLKGPSWQVAFSPDGTRLAGVDRDEVRIWDVATGQDVLLLRGSGWRRPGDGGFNPALAWDKEGRQLAAANWNSNVSIWDAGPRDGESVRTARWSAARARVPGWSLAEAEAAFRARNAFAVAFHTDRGLGGDAPDIRSRPYRGDLFLARGLIDKARQEYAAIFAAEEPDSLGIWRDFNRLLLLTGELDGHRKLCERIWVRLDANRNSEDLHAAIHACVIAPGTGHPEKLIDLARRALVEYPDNVEIHFVLGMAHLRARQWDEAKRRLHEVALADPDVAWRTWPAFALVHFGRGENAEAKGFLERAEKWLQEQGARGSEAVLFHPREWGDCRLLTSEARAIMRGGK
jgi:eukaryotic-like serine/threonine-protein kinase